MLKIALIDDHTLLRDALADIVNNFDNCRVTSTCSNGKEFMELAAYTPLPDVVLLDINMPVMDGYETAQWLHINSPDVGIIVLTMFDSEIALVRLLQTGVNAFLKKDTHPRELEFAIRSVHEKGYYYSQNSSGKLANAFRNPSRCTSFNVSFTENEIKFLKFSCSELTYKEIAKEMFISPRTIDNYRDALFEKLQVKSRVGLAMYAIKNGIIHF